MLATSNFTPQKWRLTWLASTYRSPENPVLFILSERHADRQMFVILKAQVVATLQYAQGLWPPKSNCVFTQLGVFPHLFMTVVVVLVTELHNLIKYYVNQWNRSTKRKLFVWNAKLNSVRECDKCKFLKIGVGETTVKHKKKRKHVHLQLYSVCFASSLTFLLQCKKTQVGTRGWCFVDDSKTDPFAWLTQKAAALHRKIGDERTFTCVRSK